MISGNVLFDQLYRLVDVESGLLMHIDDDDPPAAKPSRLANGLHAFDGLAEIADPHRCAVAIGHDDRIEGRGVEDLIGGVQRQRLLGAIERAFRSVYCCCNDRAADIFEADTHRGGDRRVDLHADGRLLLAVVIDQSDTWNARDSRRNVVLDVFIDFRDRQVVGRHRNRHQQRVGGVDLFIGGWVRQVLRQLPAGGVDGALDILGRAVDIAPEIELNLNGSISERTR